MPWLGLKSPGRSAAGTRGRWGEGAMSGYRCLVSVGGERTTVPGTVRASLRPREGEPPSAGDDATAHITVPMVVKPRTDDPGFRDYVTSRSGSLLRMAFLLTRNQADAEDLVQAALAKTYQAWDRIVDRNALDGYVRRAMVNTHISWWRRRRVEEYPTDDIPDRAVADHAGDSELSDALQRALDRLPSRMRAAVVLRYFEDMTEAEVADILGVSQGTVKSTVSRAVAKLRSDSDLLAD
jgi:RNA polymerase sigma-70 factor (sigma-E family)